MILQTLYIVSFLDSLSMAMVISIMTPYMLSLGASRVYIGTVGSLGALISLIWNPFVGGLSDTYGRKKILLQLLITCIIANFINTIWTTLTILFISRMLSALCTQILTLLKALIDDNIEEKEAKIGAINKTHGLGRIAFIIGGLASGQLSDWNNGTQTIFYLIITMHLINFGLISTIKEEKIIKKVQLRSLKIVLKNLTTINWSKYWDLFLIKFLIDFVFNMFLFSWRLYLTNHFGLTTKHLSYVFIILIAISSIVTFGMIKVKNIFYLNDDFGLKRLFHGIIFLSLSILGQGLAPSFNFYLLFLILMSIGRGYTDTTITEVLLLRVSSAEKGSVMGAFENTMSLGGLIAPILSGILSKLWSDKTAILVCIIPLIVAGLLTLKQKPKHL